MEPQLRKYRVVLPDVDKLKELVGPEHVLHSTKAFAVVEASSPVAAALRDYKFLVQDLEQPQATEHRISAPLALAATPPPEEKVGEVVVKVRYSSDVFESAGVKPFHALGQGEYLVDCPSEEVFDRFVNHPAVQSVSPFRYRDTAERIALQPEPSGSVTTPLALASEGEVPQRKQKVVPGEVVLSFVAPADREVAAERLTDAGVKVLSASGSILIAKQSEVLEEHLPKLKRLLSVENKHIPRKCNDVARGIIGIPEGPAPALNLTGKGQVVAVADTGLDTGVPATIHRDFQDRIVSISSFPIQPGFRRIVLNPGANDGPADRDSGHGTHVAGSVLGSGVKSQAVGMNIRGLAPEAKLVFQAVEQKAQYTRAYIRQYRREYGEDPDPYVLFGIPDNVAQLFQPAYDQEARIHSNSWGGGVPGEYDEMCRAVDLFSWQHKDFLVVAAAGNEGEQHRSGYILPGSVSSPGTAKNCLTVGACENGRTAANRPQPDITYARLGFSYPPFKALVVGQTPDNVAPFSSRGPCLDGRRKPDLVAPGTMILSTRSSLINGFGYGKLPQDPQAYMYSTGTSMATPLVAGAAACVRQFLQAHVTPAPSAALVKATLILNTRYLANFLASHSSSKSPADNEQGWGRLDLRSLNLDSSRYWFGDNIQEGDVEEFSFHVPPAGTQPRNLKVILVYTDYPSVSGVGGLVNNLNLQVVAPNGDHWFGNSTTPNGSATDDQNNVEGVVIPNPQEGEWKISILAMQVTEGPQDFAVVCSLQQ